MTARRWLYLGLFILIVAAAITMGLPAYMVFSGTKVERIPLSDDPSSLGLAYEAVSFPSRSDELALSGWYLPGGRTIAAL